MDEAAIRTALGLDPGPTLLALIAVAERIAPDAPWSAFAPLWLHLPWLREPTTYVGTPANVHPFAESGGDLHHFGSKSYVAQMTGEQRRNLVAMVSLDRVGVGRTVPLYAIDGGPTDVRDQLVRAGEQAGVPTVVGTNTGSDHESFADAGLPAARVGGTSYGAYHSAADLPAVIDRAQLARVGRLLLTWATGRTPGR